jgi:hypothetical protein
MKLSSPVISLRSCLLALVAGLMLPVPASHADIFTLTGNLTGESPATSLGSLRCLLVVLQEPGRPR